MGPKGVSELSLADSNWRRSKRLLEKEVLTSWTNLMRLWIVWGPVQDSSTVGLCTRAAHILDASNPGLSGH